MGRLKGFSSLALVIGLSAFIFALLPLRTAFEMGDDEGYEVIKGFMCSKGFKLYTQIWNDQPPVSTMILRKAFDLWGPSIFVARLVSAGFGLLLMAAFHELVRKRSGHWTALLATFFLLASPGVLLLCVSVMLEVPAFATALVSAWLLFEWGKRRHWIWLLASGAVMAVALQIKLTAALVMPAIMLELLLLSWPRLKAKLPTGKPNGTRKKGTKPPVPELQRHASSQGSDWKGLLKQTAERMILWGFGLALIFTTIGLTWGKGALASSWKSHTGSQIVAGLDRVEDHKFEPRLLQNHFECGIAAIVCLLAAFQQKRMREVSFPLVLLLTAAVIHAVHRPWWNYYYLHLAIPLAWLAGWAVSEAVKVVFRLQSKVPISFSSGATWKALALCALAALPIARSERRLEPTIKDLRRRPTVDSNPIVKKMKAYAKRANWVYSESGIYPFHAQLRVPPELAIIMPKRFWSGQITTEEIVETCKRYTPELIVLPKGRQNEEWTSLLQADYELVAVDAKNMLYVSKRVGKER